MRRTKPSAQAESPDVTSGRIRSTVGRLHFSKKICLLVCLFVFIFFITLQPALAVSEEECRRRQQEDTSDGVACWESLLGEVGQRKKTLQSEIARFDVTIALTTAQIAQTAKEIQELEKEIASLITKIGRLDISLDQLSEILIIRIAETYKKGQIDPLVLLFSSKDFSEFVSRYKYLRVMQLHDRKLMIQMETARTSYADQKTLKEEKQEELEAAKARLESQKVLLAQQKRDKEYLLEVTRNDERRYLEMLAAARAEATAIARILAGYGEVAEVGPVNAGETIGTYIYGASACSTGSHLHFEVAQDGSHQNPAGHLRNISLMFEDNVNPFTPGGSWDWPIIEPIRITQEYGDTFWSRLGWYSGGPHTGIDMVSGSFENPGPRTVKSVVGGTLYHGAIECGGGTLLYVKVDHADTNIDTYYLHVFY